MASTNSCSGRMLKSSFKRNAKKAKNANQPIFFTWPLLTHIFPLLVSSHSLFYSSIRILLFENTGKSRVIVSRLKQSNTHLL